MHVPMRPSWNPEWETGHPDIDAQHRAMLDHVAEVFERLWANPEAEQFDQIEFLENYLRMHLEAEELAMEEAGYPSLLRHHQRHQAMRTKFRDLVSNLGPSQVLDFFVHWMIDHIDIEDREMATFLRKSGVRLAIPMPTLPRDNSRED